MKRFFAIIIALIFITSCSAEDSNLSSSASSENQNESSSSVSSDKSDGSKESSSEPKVPIEELTQTENIPENGAFIKVELSCADMLYCYALTDSGNLYRFDYTDESMECIRTGVLDFWGGGFYREPNIVFENGWIFTDGKYYYKPDFVAVEGAFFLEKDGDISYLDNNKWKTLDADAAIIKAQQPDSLRYTDSENNLFIFSAYIGEPVLLAENVADYDWNYFDKLNYAEETIYITEEGKVGIIFDEEYSDPETFLSFVPENAEKIYSSSGNFLFQKADGTYLYGNKSVNRNRHINIIGVDADIHFRDYAIIGTDGNIYLHIEELTYFGEGIADEYTVIKDFVIELP